MRTLLPVAFCLITLSACNENSDSEPPPLPEEKTAQQTLDENQTKWADANLTSYTYAYEAVCFCVPEGNIVVNVRDGVVASAFYSPSGVLLTPERLSEMRTVDDFFGYIQAGLDQSYEKMDVTYDEQFGFPAMLDVDVSSGLADDEVVYTIGSFQ